MAFAAGRSRQSVSYPAGVAMVLAAGTFWSFIPLGIRHIEEADVWQILFFRSLGLLPLLFGLMWFRSGGHPLRMLWAAGLPGILGGFALIAAYAGGIGAIQQTSVANAAFLFATAPFLAAFIGWALLGEPVRTATWIAMVAALAGMILMVMDSFTTGRWHGDALAMLSALGFAFFTVALRWGKEAEMLPVSFLGGLFALELSGLYCLGSGSGFSIPVRDMAISFGLGFVMLGMGMALYTFGSKVVPAAELALLCMTEVVLGPVWVWLVLGETARIETLIGGAILLVAIFYNALTGLRRKPVPITY